LALSVVDPFKPDTHDHGRCVHQAVEQAVALCSTRGSRLTDLRRRVLELVWRSHAPIGAYQILDRLAVDRGPVAPPTVYRALDFLTREGLVHRIESLNAYVGCSSPTLPHEAHFFICRGCGEAAEFDDEELAATLMRCVRRASFRIESSRIELSGLCARCSGPVANA
jgi:Fur family transcriptional regulator, zinc uptake regulator